MFKFLGETIKHFKTVGAIAASSRELSELLVKSADIRSAQTIVEFGPGTGVATQVILEYKRPDALFWAIEMNETFVEICKNKFPNALIYHDNALNLPKYLQKYERTHCDIIYSSLPWTLFDDKLQNQLLHVIRESLREGGEFLTFAYIHGMYFPNGFRFRNKLRKLFRKLDKSEVVWLNTPPALVYRVVK